MFYKGKKIVCILSRKKVVFKESVTKSENKHNIPHTIKRSRDTEK